MKLYSLFDIPRTGSFICDWPLNCRACRHGDRCSRHHNKPNLSPTILLPNLYQNPSLNAPLGPDGLPIVVDGKFVQEDYEVRFFVFFLLQSFQKRYASRQHTSIYLHVSVSMWGLTVCSNCTQCMPPTQLQVKPAWQAFKKPELRGYNGIDFSTGSEEEKTPIYLRLQFSFLTGRSGRSELTFQVMIQPFMQKNSDSFNQVQPNISHTFW